jgi:alpha-mannosidase
VALLTDGTYGHSVDAATLGLSLLKSGAWPDPRADEGAHRFRYALLPHSGSWQQAEVPQAAFELGTPLRVVTGSGTGFFLHLDGDGVTAETVKVADDHDGTVVRLVESHNRPALARVQADRPLASAHRTDLAERILEDLDVAGDRVDVVLRPHEVATLLLRWLP